MTENLNYDNGQPPVDHEAWVEKLKTRRYLTRGQWFRAFNRRVTVTLAEARKVITTLEGRQLHLFSEDQTAELN